jgi:hypothetical protein
MTPAGFGDHRLGDLLARRRLAARAPDCPRRARGTRRTFGTVWRSQAGRAIKRRSAASQRARRVLTGLTLQPRDEGPQAPRPMNHIQSSPDRADGTRRALIRSSASRGRLGEPRGRGQVPLGGTEGDRSQTIRFCNRGRDQSTRCRLFPHWGRPFAARHAVDVLIRSPQPWPLFGAQRLRLGPLEPSGASRGTASAWIGIRV